MTEQTLVLNQYTDLNLTHTEASDDGVVAPAARRLRRVLTGRRAAIGGRCDILRDRELRDAVRTVRQRAGGDGDRDKQEAAAVGERAERLARSGRHPRRNHSDEPVHCERLDGLLAAGRPDVQSLDFARRDVHHSVDPLDQRHRVRSLSARARPVPLRPGNLAPGDHRSHLHHLVALRRDLLPPRLPEAQRAAAPERRLGRCVARRLHVLLARRYRSK